MTLKKFSPATSSFKFQASCYNIFMIYGLPTEQVIFYTLIVIIVLLVIWIIRLEWKLGKLLVGKRSISLDDSLATLERRFNVLKIFKDQTEAKLAHFDNRLKKESVAIETVRFNPFKGTGSGGNQSFATAFLSEAGEGVVISTLYSREHVSVFAKPVADFSSTHELTYEEKEVIKKASEKLKN